MYQLLMHTSNDETHKEIREAGGTVEICQTRIGWGAKATLPGESKFLGRVKIPRGVEKYYQLPTGSTLVWRKLPFLISLRLVPGDKTPTALGTSQETGS
mgnify:CR=1 FL=1